MNQKALKREKESEYLKGENPDKSNIGRYRSPAYARKKNTQNPLAGYGNVDLIKSGRFVNNLYAYRTYGSRYLFANKISYGSDLIKRYGQDILGLNQEAFNRMQVQLFKPELIKFIKRHIGQ